MARFFNTTGPCEARRHYMVPGQARLPGVLRLIEREQYFVLHAPRQVGKTTAMRSLASELRASGLCACWITLEESQGISAPVDAEPVWIQATFRWSRTLAPAWRAPEPTPYFGLPTGTRFGEYLRA